MSGNKKRKLEEEAAAAASDGEVHAIDGAEVHVVTFRAPEFHLDASESAMLLKSALAPTHSSRRSRPPLLIEEAGRCPRRLRRGSSRNARWHV